jgi:hypothetical protein
VRFVGGQRRANVLPLTGIPVTDGKCRATLSKNPYPPPRASPAEEAEQKAMSKRSIRILISAVVAALVVSLGSWGVVETAHAGSSVATCCG